MAVSISEFKARLGGQNLADPATFRVLFSGAIIDTEETRGLAFLCNKATLPGRTFATQPYSTHGPERKVPHQNIYDDLVLGIYCKEDMSQRAIFQEWQNFICDPSFNEFSYHDDYTTDIIVEQLGADGEVKYAVKYIDAFPVVVNPLSLDWSSAGAFHNLDVTFAYRFWREEPISLNPFGNFLSVNSLYPNFDVSGAIQKLGVGVLSRAEGQTLSRIQKGIRFGSNVGRSGRQRVSDSIISTVNQSDNFFIN